MFKLHVNTWENVKMIMIKHVKSDGFFEIYLRWPREKSERFYLLLLLFFLRKRPTMIVNKNLNFSCPIVLNQMK